jgi:hypothetical protein
MLLPQIHSNPTPPLHDVGPLVAALVQRLSARPLLRPVLPGGHWPL